MNGTSSDGQGHALRSATRVGVTTVVAAVVVIGIIAVGAVSAYAVSVLGGPGTGQGGTTTSTTTAAASTAGAAGTLTMGDAMALLRAPVSGAVVSRGTDSLTFGSMNIDLMAFAIPAENASSLTGLQPPAYSHGDVFVMGGLIDPTIYVPQGARVNFTVVNMDTQMYNDLVVSTLGPPYPSQMSQYMAGGGMMQGGSGDFLYMMSVLDPASQAGGWASMSSYMVTVPSNSNLWYLCTYPGHAEGGMYGSIIATSTASTTTSTSVTSEGTTSSASTFVLPPGTMSIGDAMALMKTVPAGAVVSRADDSVTFTSPSVDIVAFADMAENATAITGMQPPSYSQGDVFMVYGLINPTIYVPKGATVHVTIVNLDDDMYHDFVFTTISPPYSYMMMQGMMGGGSFLYMMPILGPANYGAGWAPVYSYTVTVPGAGSLWYVCTYPGHAQSGMYGEVIATG